jgi:tRNA(Ile)-lysidine synthase
MSKPSSSTPIGGEEFASLMARFGPFGPRPRLAVGLSGGADSLALTLLLKDWVDGHGGAMLALTVDHGLRPDSAEEARIVSGLCASLGIEHRTLVWHPGAGAGKGQAGARAARYRLLSDAAQGAGIFHLALAHHGDDQAETFLFRLSRGSGLLGLAAMPAARSLPPIRLFRPFLDVPGERLRATVAARGFDWIEDPSNRDPAYARVRLRRLREEMVPAGFSGARLTAAARTIAGYRREMEHKAAGLIARAVRVHREGYATLARSAFLRSERPTRVMTLSSLLTVVGGRVHPPRRASLDRLLDFIEDGTAGSTTLAGARVLRQGSAGETVLLVRENRNLERVKVAAGRSTRWDGRFDVTVIGTSEMGLSVKICVGPLGEVGWRDLPRDLREEAKSSCPWEARLVLPALWDKMGLISQPHLGYLRDDWAGSAAFGLKFRPRAPLTRLFTLV